MPKSKRNRQVTLSKTSKKGKAQKGALIDKIREAVEAFKSAYVFQYENMRNQKLKEVRQYWQSSRFFLGKNKVMALALGRATEEEVKPNIHNLSKFLHGSCGLMFTDSSRADVVKFFNEYSEPMYARSGFEATEDFDLTAGVLPEMHFSMEPKLRALGLPTKLNNGQVELLANVAVCKKGDVLTPEQCKILEFFERPMAVFKIDLVGGWDAKSNKFEQLKESAVPVAHAVGPSAGAGEGDDDAKMGDEDVAEFDLAMEVKEAGDGDDDGPIDITSLVPIPAIMGEPAEKKKRGGAKAKKGGKKAAPAPAAEEQSSAGPARRTRGAKKGKKAGDA